MPNHSTTPRIDGSGYVPELDTLRTLAILLVMCLHWLPERSWINRFQSAGNFGVYLFFVLSGFLITRILMRCRENIESEKVTRLISLRQFYIRRFLRIFPVYYFVLLIAVILNVKGVRHALPWHAVYLSNVYYFLHGFDGPASHLWTLSVEEQFYLLWPLAILLLPLRGIVPFVVVCALVGTGFHDASRTSDTAWSLLTPASVNFLATGALVAVCESPLCGSTQIRARLLRIYLLITALLVGLEVAVFCLPRLHFTLDLERTICQTMTSVLFAWVIARTSQGVAGPIGHLLRFPPAVYLGRISYGLYLYHQFVRWGLEQRWPLFHDSPGANWARIAMIFAVRFVATACVASLSWFAFEKPLNDLKRFFPYSGKPRSLFLEERGIPVPATVETKLPTGPLISPGMNTP